MIMYNRTNNFILILTPSTYRAYLVSILAFSSRALQLSLVFQTRNMDHLGPTRYYALAVPQHSARCCSTAESLF